MTQQYEKNSGKFKPKNLKNPPKLPISRIQNPSVPTDTIHLSQHVDSLSEDHIDNSLSPHSTNGTNRTEMLDHETDGTISPRFDFSKSASEAPTSLSEIDLLNGVSVEPPFSSEPTIKFQAKKNENEGMSKKVKSSDPETYSNQSPDALINPGPITSEEIEVNASESGVAEDAEIDEQGQMNEGMAEKEKEDAPNLDDVFGFFYDNDSALEIEEANEDPNYGKDTGDEENDWRTEKETQTDVKIPSKRKNRSNIDADANVDEGLPKKKDKLPHRIRCKRRKVDLALLEVPENEINPRQISIRNLILLAEAKEKKWNKEEASGTSNGDASSTRRRRAQEEFEFFHFEEHEEESNGKQLEVNMRKEHDFFISFSLNLNDQQVPHASNSQIESNISNIDAVLDA